MATRTVTQTQTVFSFSIPPRVESSSEPEEKTSDQLSDQLLHTLEKHSDCTGPISSSMRQWGIDLLNRDTRGLSEAAFNEELGFRIDQLVYEILISPLDKSCLTDPMIYQDMVWERWMLDDFLTIFPCSFRDTTSRVYDFAVDMLTWIKDVKRSKLLPERVTSREIQRRSEIRPLDRELFINAEGVIALQLKREFYLTHVPQARELAQTRETIRVLRQETGMMQFITEEVRARAAEVEQRTKENIIAFKGIFDRDLQLVKDTHQQTIQLYDSRLQSSQREIRDLSGKLDKSIKTNAEQAVEIASLRAAIEQERQRVNSLQGCRKKDKCSIS